MGKALTAEQRDAKKRALFEFLVAAARNSEVCPTLDKLGRLTRISGSVVSDLIDELRREGKVRYWIRKQAMIGQYRVVQIVATGQRTATPVRRRAPPPGAAHKLANYDQESRKDLQARDHAIYGGLVEDVKWLRHRGWVITKTPGGFMCGNALVDAADIVAKAARERRLAGIN